MLCIALSKLRYHTSSTWCTGGFFLVADGQRFAACIRRNIRQGRSAAASDLADLRNITGADMTETLFRQVLSDPKQTSPSLVCFRQS